MPSRITTAIAVLRRAEQRKSISLACPDQDAALTTRVRLQAHLATSISTSAIIFRRHQKNEASCRQRKSGQQRSNHLRRPFKDDRERPFPSPKRTYSAAVTFVEIMPGRGGKRPPMTRDVQVSKKLSWLLRHGATSEGLELDAAGFISLDQVLANRNFRSLKVTFDEVRGVVADNAKQRFTMVLVPGFDDQQDKDASHWQIRANQGHSLAVEDDKLITALTLQSTELPALVVHGTRREHWPKIVASGGLKTMGRNHVHFATGLPESLKSISDDAGDTKAVISGMRNSSNVLIYLDLPKALQGGLKFGISDNGVVLTEGDDAGLVRLQYLKLVEQKGGHVLLRDGSIVAELQ